MHADYFGSIFSFSCSFWGELAKILGWHLSLGNPGSATDQCNPTRNSRLFQVFYFSANIFNILTPTHTFGDLSR